jgi:two-component system response regulator AtoC
VKILVVDDDLGLRKSLALLLQAEDYEVSAEGDPEAALRRALDGPFDIVLCDVRMPKMDGLEFLRRYQEGGGAALVIMMSAYGGEDAAIEAMKEGAYDYLPKPFRSDEVVLTLRKAAERERLRGRVATLEAELARWQHSEVVADSLAMRKVMDLASRVAPHATTVLVTGESGTGKEVVARAVHRMSPRRDAPFIAVNCAAIPENLLESELFGHQKGAFTGANADRAGLFEEASGGTLLLDEIGDLPLGLQAKLLRVLQEAEVRRVGETRTRKVDVRVIAATARDMEKDVKAGHFREDLYYRLNVVRIHIPSLRERPEDLEGLVAKLLGRAGDRAGRQVMMSAEAMAAIRQQPWPGNVRELENALERAVVLSSDGVIRATDLLLDLSGNGAREVATAASLRTLRDAVAVAERGAIQEALARTDGNRQRAARLLVTDNARLDCSVSACGVCSTS